MYPFTKYCHRQGLPSLVVLVRFGWTAGKYQSWVPGSSNDVSQHSILHDENQNAAVKSLSYLTSKRVSNHAKLLLGTSKLMRQLRLSRFT